MDIVDVLKQEYSESSTRSIYPDLPPMNLEKCVWIQNNFINNGLRLHPKQKLSMPVTAEEDRAVNTSASFYAHP